MFPEHYKNIEKISRILQGFMDVLRINLSIVDAHGLPVLMPRAGNGWELLAFSLGERILDNFIAEDRYLKYEDPFSTTTFAIPLLQNNVISGYLVAGPVILNKKEDPASYARSAKELNQDPQQAAKIIDEIRVISHNHLETILNLLTETSHFLFPPRDFYGSLLDISMDMAHAECGSLMVLDGQTGELHIAASRGIAQEKIQNTRLKIGEGIAGLAVLQKTNFVINDTHEDNRVKNLLKRPEIKQSIIIPLISEKNDVLGVLNISTKKAGSRLASNSTDILKSLSRMTSAAIESAGAP